MPIIAVVWGNRARDALPGDQWDMKRHGVSKGFKGKVRIIMIIMIIYKYTYINWLLGKPLEVVFVGSMGDFVRPVVCVACVHVLSCMHTLFFYTFTYIYIQYTVYSIQYIVACEFGWIYRGTLSWHTLLPRLALPYLLEPEESSQRWLGGWGVVVKARGLDIP